MIESLPPACSLCLRHELVSKREELGQWRLRGVGMSPSFFWIFFGPSFLRSGKFDPVQLRGAFETQRAQWSKKFEISIEIENFDREWNFRASHPPRPFFFWGNQDIEIKIFERDQEIRSRLKISMEIKYFWSLGPLGTGPFFAYKNGRFASSFLLLGLGLS